MKILEIEHCRKRFGSNEVLSDISLTVSEGQVVSIIGPSGSGKSTLLRCATLLETMDGGSLKYLGKSAVRDEGGKAVYASNAELHQLRSCFGGTRRRSTPPPGTCSPRWAWPTGRTPIPTSSPAGSSSGCPSRGRWP